jgi:hypothetical protein
MRGRWYYEYHGANANMSFVNFISVHMDLKRGAGWGTSIKGVLKKNSIRCYDGEWL